MPLPELKRKANMLVHFAFYIRQVILDDTDIIRSTVIGNEANSKISITIYHGDNHLPVTI